ATMNLTAGNIKHFPLFFPEDNNIKIQVENLVSENIDISKQIWNFDEVSWDFNKHNLIKFKPKNNNLLSRAYIEYDKKIKEYLIKLKNNEEVLNEIFIKIYGVESELSPEITLKDLFVTPVTEYQEVCSFLSYFIGCLMGRYSLDVEGIAYAGGDFDESKYKIFRPNSSGLVLLTDDHYFDNDIIGRLKEFLSVAFSPETVEDNIKWLAEALEMRKNEN